MKFEELYTAIEPMIVNRDFAGAIAHMSANLDQINAPIDRAHLRLMAGTCHGCLMDYKKMEEEFRLANIDCPGELESVTRYARALMMDGGRYSEAIAVLESANSHDPDDSWESFLEHTRNALLGAAYCLAGKPDAGLPYLGRAYSPEMATQLPEPDITGLWLMKRMKVRLPPAAVSLVLADLRRFPALDPAIIDSLRVLDETEQAGI